MKLSTRASEGIDAFIGICLVSILIALLLPLEWRMKFRRKS